MAWDCGLLVFLYMYVFRVFRCGASLGDEVGTLEGARDVRKGRQLLEQEVSNDL
jgi:hypothetical protein